MRTNGAATPLRKSESAFICDKCSSACDSFDDLQVHMLTTHHSETTETKSSANEENEKDEVPMSESETGNNKTTTKRTPQHHPDSTTTTRTSTSSKPPQPVTDPRQCSAEGCDNVETTKRFSVCGPCKMVGVKVPYCSGYVSSVELTITR